jgi:hypothetical protein
LTTIGNTLRTAPDPRKALLAYFETACRAGSDIAGWDRDELRSAWRPPPLELHELAD